MSSYTQVFGGNTIYPSDVTYLALSLAADVELAWPIEANPGDTTVARILDISADGNGRNILMPAADLTSPGQTVLFNNVGSYDIAVKTSTGTTIATVTPGTQWEIYLISNATAAGTWRAYQMGASTATVQPSALAGYGLVVTGTQLSQEQQANTFNSNYTFGLADRSGLYVWTGGVGTLSLMSAADAGNGWFASVRNEGTGNLTVDPAGANTINGDSSLVLRPGDSATICTDGATYWTIGLGQDPVFAFDYTSIDLTGEASPYVLSGAELNRIAYQFVGVLTADIVIEVPSTTQQYWIANDTTGAYDLSLATATQVTPLGVTQASRGIYYCQGTDVVKADTAGISLPIGIGDGGTGASTASAARVNLGGTTTGIAVFTAASAAAARTGLGAAGAGANSDITSLAGLTTPLSVPQGGTGQAGPPTNGQIPIGKTSDGTLNFAAITAGSGITVTNGAGTITIAATGGGGSVTSVGMSGGSTGLTYSGSPITGSGTITLGGVLVVANGGTGVATLTGIVKGNGTSAFSAATPGTDYVAPGTATTFTAKQTFSGAAGVLAFKSTNMLEVITLTASAATGTINYDATSQSIQWYTTNASANFVLNFRGDASNTLNSLMATGEAITLAFMNTNGGTARYPTSIQVDGTTAGVTTRWQGGTAPAAGNASSVDAYTFTIVKTGSATFSVFATQTRFA